MKRFAICLLVGAALLLGASAAYADIIGTFVSAVGGPGGNTVNAADNDDGNFYSYTNSDTDGYWVYRTNYPSEPGGHCLEGSYPEMASLPVMKTTISSLTPGQGYAVSAVWAGDIGDAGWGDISASLTAASSLTRYTVNDGLTTSTDILLESPSTYSLQSPLGVAIADANGQIAVYIGKTGSPADCRTRYEGVAYSAVPEPSSIALVCCGLLGLLAYAWKKRK